jgi:PiT family inorganic phosphate transporter
VLTLPAAAGVGAATFGVTRIFGNGAAGPLVVSIVLVLALVWVLWRRLMAGRPLTAGA